MDEFIGIVQNIFSNSKTTDDIDLVAKEMIRIIVLNKILNKNFTY